MPRKSDATVRADADADVSTVQPTPAAQTPATQTSPSEKRDKEKEAKDLVSIEELNLPKSIISRLAKGVLPPNIQIQGNAVLALRQSATVFINYLASHANEHVQNAGKKTVMPADVFQALEDTEFGFLREPLEAEFAKFNQIQSAKRSTYRQKAAAAKRGAGTPLADADTSALAEGTPSKKPRVEGDEAEEEEEDVPDHEVEDDVVDEDEEEEEEEEEEEDEEEEEEEGGGVEGKDDRDETLDVEERRRVGDESGDESD